MVRVAIVGASGYTGIELIRILNQHPQAELKIITSRVQSGMRVDEYYPALRRHCDLAFEDADPDRLAQEVDLVFTALPHQAAMDFVPEVLGRGLKVVDLSADYRFQDAKVYEAWYQPHKTPELLSQSVYGLPELHREEIRASKLVGNPGCYSTSIILATAPLLSRKLIRHQSLIADSKSGVSGAGRGLSLATHFCEVSGGFKAYKVAEHRHTPEIEQELTRVAGEMVRITFTPHLVPMSRGILSTVYAELLDGANASLVTDAFRFFYRDAPFVRLCGSNVPTTLQVRGSNYCDVGWRVDERTGRVVIVSVIDNLTRGASGQSVCNMNLMCGLSEELGLGAPPWQP
ncbi:MAG: N-acetyl-gamma-glutamyl-phosphate reductase [Desulforhabdus sp.]|jgi:N-acetyl-gamma-glutamyl-phosphate reductase|nr:N-acetyl-gamma-glutamyl-phosphate reductase [Desulforhabdus sp.]